MSTHRGICARCNRDRRIQGRRLCEPCYKRTAAEGRIADYPTRFEINADRNARIIELLKEGDLPSAAIAREVGTTPDVVRSLARREGLAAVYASAVSPSWLARIEPAPDVVPCVGRTMDFDGFMPAELHPTRNAAVRSALDLCATCPLATRQWCLDTVDPRGIGKEWQGVAGGVVWSKGRLVYMPVEAEEVAS